ncbi:MAG: hypothetical protein QOI93_3843 [Rhodospirillaceae bacterium]|nr:hypothetical protein [Rhodospirillaceae bacterium]
MKPPFDVRLLTAPRTHVTAQPFKSDSVANIMLAADDTKHHDLRNGRAPWKDGHRPARAILEEDRRCEVLVVGAGITGSLMAEHLTALGHQVCIVDRERAGLGSTAASTALLLWEIDRSLGILADLYGFERAARVYRQSLRALSGLKTLVRARGVRCALRDCSSLYLAAGSIGDRELRAEHEVRTRAGLPGILLGHRTLLGEFGFDREAAILSPFAADADPLCLAHGLLAAAAAAGACVIDGDAVDYQNAGRRVGVTLDSGHAIEADWVVLATGYVMPDIVKSDLHRMSSSWALATPAQPPERRWRDGILPWEATQNYLYARTTTDKRIIVGGEDDASVIDSEKREAATPGKTKAILARLKALFPRAEARADVVWSGVFGTTGDGLPLIGAVPGCPRLLAAYGYGGNGITFGFLASRLLAGLIGGRHEAWYDDFRLERPRPKALDAGG